MKKESFVVREATADDHKVYDHAHAVEAVLASREATIPEGMAALVTLLAHGCIETEDPEMTAYELGDALVTLVTKLSDEKRKSLS